MVATFVEWPVFDEGLDEGRDGKLKGGDEGRREGSDKGGAG